MENSDLRERALLVKLTTKKFGINKKDRDATEETAIAQKADIKSTAVVKQIIPKQNAQYKALTSFMDKMTNTFRAMTGEWDGDWRIVSGKGYGSVKEFTEECTMKIESLKEDFRKALPDIMTKLPQDHVGLGKMYDARNYPEIDEIVGSFKVIFDTDVIPERSNNLMIGLDDDRIEKLITDANAKDVQRTKDLNAHTHGRVSKALTGMIESLDNFGDEIENSKRTKTFRDTLVSNMADVADVLKGLNIAGDPAMDKLADDITAKLTKVDAPALRGAKVKGDNRTPEMIEQDASALRKEVSEKAKEIADDLDGVFGIAS